MLSRLLAKMKVETSILLLIAICCITHVVSGTMASQSQNQCNCSHVQTMIQEALNNERKCSGVMYGGKCIRFIYTSGYGMTWSEARSMCVYHGGQLLDIENAEMYDLVYNYAKQAWNAYIDRNPNYVEFWLASAYQHQDGTVRSSTTGNSIYSRWHPGYPVNTAGFSYMGLVVATKASRGNSYGMFNHYSNHPYLVPMCSFPV